MLEIITYNLKGKSEIKLYYFRSRFYTHIQIVKKVQEVRGLYENLKLKNLSV